MNKFMPVKDSKGQKTTFSISKTGAIENIKSRGDASHVVSSLFTMGSTQNMSSELKKMGIGFDYPKSSTLIQYLISIVNGKDFTVLDSFAGSGTTAHSVLNLNKKDGGNRKFILVEMMDYAETIISDRIKKVINGYIEVQVTGGSFDFYELGQPLFDENGNLSESVGLPKIQNYVWYTETKTPLKEGKHEDNAHFLGKYNDTSYYFYYESEAITALDHSFLASVKTKAEQYVIYADNCLLTKEFMVKQPIIFKKIPRDITRF
jgi:adenine-specific DNA-methyltransferase